MAAIKAKFQVSSVKLVVDKDGNPSFAEVEMQAVYGDSPENKEWSQYTPNGQIRMHISKAGAMQAFKPGEQYLVDFTLADAPAPG